MKWAYLLLLSATTAFGHYGQSPADRNCWDRYQKWNKHCPVTKTSTKYGATTTVSEGFWEEINCASWYLTRTLFCVIGHSISDFVHSSPWTHCHQNVSAIAFSLDTFTETQAEYDDTDAPKPSQLRDQACAQRPVHVRSVSPGQACALQLVSVPSVSRTLLLLIPAKSLL